MTTARPRVWLPGLPVSTELDPKGTSYPRNHTFLAYDLIHLMGSGDSLKHNVCAPLMAGYAVHAQTAWDTGGPALYLILRGVLCHSALDVDA